MKAVDLYKDPKLKNPVLVAAWPGMGGVALIAAKYLRDELGAEEFGQIAPFDFFDLNAVTVRDHVVEEPEFPESKFYFWKGPKGKELIIFIDDAQPSAKGYQLANLVLDVAQNFKARKVYTFAAAPAHIYHTRKPRILGATTRPRLMDKLTKQGVVPMGAGTISGLNGMLLGVARQRKLEGVCLLGEIPVYATPIPNPKAAKVVLGVLVGLLGIELDMSGLDEWAKKTDEEMEKNMEVLRESHAEEAGRLIEYFDHLREQAGTEETELQESSEFSTDQLLSDVEKFLKRKRKEGN